MLELTKKRQSEFTCLSLIDTDSIFSMAFSNDVICQALHLGTTHDQNQELPAVGVGHTVLVVERVVRETASFVLTLHHVRYDLATQQRDE